MNSLRGYIGERSLAEEMFRLAVEACPNGMIMVDSDGEIVMANSEIEQQFGYKREELIGQRVDILVPRRLQAQHALHRASFTHRPGAGEPETRRMGAGRDLFGLRKDGTEFPVEVGLNPIRAGEHLLVLGVIVDISQRKQIERLKEEFVSTVSHELRTPLTSIAGSLGLLAGQWSGKLPESAARLLSIAHKNSQRLVRLINDILDIEKIESGRVVFNSVRVSAKSIVEQAIEDNRGFALGYGVGIQLDPASIDCELNVDPDRLCQVITNLLSNAAKFSPSSGDVIVSVRSYAAMVRIAVRDYGSGVPESFSPHIFGKFAQADGTISKDKGGTGLGLSIVKQIVLRLGGEVGFIDAAGGGTEFWVDLPIWDDSAGGEIDLLYDAAAPRILLCDDDRAVARTVRLRLGAAGFAVDFAHTVDMAMTRSAATKYAVVLVDLRLRGGDGIDLILRMREIPSHRNTPILVLSEDTEHGRGDVRSSRLNVLYWLGKPIDFSRLIQLLRVLTAPQTRERPRILHLDDDHDILSMVMHTLHPIADVISADTIESARHIIATDRIDLAILDTELRGSSGLDLLPELTDDLGHWIPVILFSALSGEMVCGDQVDVAIQMPGTTLSDLLISVSDRLTLLPAGFPLVPV
ncbi:MULTISPECIES: PAS domain S-box protein [unclassified Tardiphaga]|uniref:PAS domain S-box protein n=1 Tax=unclassified Tardiphaga TaxID=2631404 RepID=UPI001FEF48CC|nr:MULTISPECIES: PAS domain S-box protein [unclassified Tardiphaga]